MTTGTRVEVRVAGPDDWQEWRDLRRRALATDPDAFGAAAADEETLTEADWRDRLGRSRGVLAWMDGVAVGMGGSFQDSAASLAVVAMWVATEARGRGIGRMILTDVLQHAETTGLRVSLWVADGNPARRLYEAAGFVGTGEREPIRPGATLMKSRMELRR